MVAWSHSVLDSFETCAHRHNLTKITKVVKEGQSAEMAEGNRVHKAMEMRVKKHEPLPEDLQKYEPIAASLLRAAEGGVIHAEQQMALTAGFAPTGWFGKDVWVRGITDVTILKGTTAFVGDYKTGKPKEGSSQLKLTAAITMHREPQVTKVVNSFIWLKTGGVTKEVYTRDDLSSIWQDFIPRVQRLDIAIQEQKFPKRPSGLCARWCPVPRHLCEHSGA